MRYADLIVYGERSGDAERLSVSVDPRTEVERVGDWRSFQRRFPRADCGVAVIRRLAQDRYAGRLGALRQRFPLKPLVLVTQRDAANLLHVRNVVIDEIVWLSSVDRTLLPAIARARADTFFRRLARNISEAEDIPPLLRRALILACRTNQPVRSVGKLADAAFCDRRTLWRQWRQVSSEAQRFRAEAGAGMFDLLPTCDIFR